MPLFRVLRRFAVESASLHAHRCGIGFLVGILPGIGGSATLALMIPFIYKMTPQEAFPFYSGCHSVVSTDGGHHVGSLWYSGRGNDRATVVDGYPWPKKGEAGRALGAALMSSLVGALIGAAFLAVSIPIVRPLVLALVPPKCSC